MPPAALGRMRAALRRHHAAAVWALLLLGAASALVLPLAGKKCFLDEKALLVGGAFPTVRQLGSVDDAVSAYNSLATRQNMQQQQQHASTLTELAGAAAAGAAPSLRFHRTNVSLGAAGPAQRCAVVHTVVRAPRSDGSEGLVLWVQQSGGGGSGGGSGRPHADAFAAAVGVAAAMHLTRVRWLAKDVIVAFADAGCPPLAAAEAWLSAYNSGHRLFDFPRAGLLQQALALELPQGAELRVAELAVHGWQGLLPNADLYYQIKRNLDIHTGLPVRLAAALRPPAWLERGAASLAAALPGADAAAGSRYASELAAAAGFGMQLAAGEPDGAHGAFLERGIDATTLRLVGSDSSTASSMRAPVPAAVTAAAAHALTAVELALRTCNNLQERLHHSTALYLLLSPDRMITIAVYLAPPGLLLAAAAAQALLEARRSQRAPASAWRPAWICAAAIHAAAFVAALGGHRAARPARAAGVEGGSSLAQLAAGIVAAAAALAWWAGSVSPAAVAADCSGGRGSDGSDSSKSEDGGSSCSSMGGPLRLAAAVMLLLEGVALLLGHWALCWLLLLAALPLLAATSAQAGGAGSRLAVLAAACLPAAGLLRACLAWAPGSLAFALLTAQVGATLACCLLALLF